MSLSNDAENALLDLLFGNTDWANIGDATGLQASSADGSFYISLHTADPGEAGDQTTNEISYTGYARVAVARGAAGWTVSGNAVENAASILFGEMTAGAGGTATYIGIGTDSSGAGNLLFSHQISAPVGGILVAVGSTPEIAAGALTVTVD